MWIKALTVAQMLVLTRFVLMAVEMLLIRTHLVHGHYTWKDTLASIGMRAGNYASNVMLAGVTAVVFAFFYQFRLIDFPMNSVYAWAAIVVLDDFAYYWFHRASHECRFWWAAHVNHHSSQEYNLSTAIQRYVDRNYAGMFMVWDRMFGTFAQETDKDPPKYGLIHNIDTYNPIRIAFHEWTAMFRDVWRARSARDVVRYIFGPPGWRPDGSGATAANIHAAWRGMAANA